MKTVNPRERDIQQSILDYCAKAGIFARRRNVAGAQRMPDGSFVRLGTKGQSDIWGILKYGKHFECEIKRPGEEPSDTQMQWLRDCASAGALAFWTDNLDEFIEIVKHDR